MTRGRPKKCRAEPSPAQPSKERMTHDCDSHEQLHRAGNASDIRACTALRRGQYGAARLDPVRDDCGHAYAGRFQRLLNQSGF